VNLETLLLEKYKTIKMVIVSKPNLKADTKLLAEAFSDSTNTMEMTGTQAMETLSNNQMYKTFGNQFSVKQVNNAISCIKEKCTLPEDLKNQVATKMTLDMNWSNSLVSKNIFY
jgi:hypothetical protein